MDKPAVDELNTLLKGEEMAVEAYEKFIQGIQEHDTKKELQQIQMNHKNHSAMLAQRIQALGGKPQYGTGVAGLMANAKISMENMAGRSALEVLKEAYDGEDKGIAAAEKAVGKSLDYESAELVNRVLSNDHDHLKRMARLIGKEEGV